MSLGLDNLLKNLGILTSHTHLITKESLVLG